MSFLHFHLVAFLHAWIVLWFCQVTHHFVRISKMFLKTFVIFLNFYSTLCEHEDKTLDKPYFIDHLGYKLNWTDLNDGWTQSWRETYMKLQKRINLQIGMGPPRFTKLGYKKMKIPEHLLETLKTQKIGKLAINSSCIER